MARVTAHVAAAGGGGGIGQGRAGGPRRFIHSRGRCDDADTDVPCPASLPLPLPRIAVRPIAAGFMASPRVLVAGSARARAFPVALACRC